MDACNLREAIASNGFVVVKKAIEQHAIDETVREVRQRKQFLEEHDRQGLRDALQQGFLPMWNSGAMWRNRSANAISDVYQCLLGTDQLWVSLDRIGYREPKSSESGRIEGHWDDDKRRWDFAEYQGILAISDTGENSGGFACCSNLFRLYRDFGKEAALGSLKSTPVELNHVDLEAGDFLVFDYRLYHATTPHLTSTPRIVQYIAMRTVGSETERAHRLEAWRQGSWLGDIRTSAYAIPDTPSVSLMKKAQKLLGMNT